MGWAADSAEFEVTGSSGGGGSRPEFEAVTLTAHGACARADTDDDEATEDALGAFSVPDRAGVD